MAMMSEIKLTDTGSHCPSNYNDSGKVIADEALLAENRCGKALPGSFCVLSVFR